jgi:antitoxin component of RelBE/YafQ-DinJ toxin-antitoxin module
MKRNIQVIVRLTEEEREMVREACEKLGISMANYFRILIRRTRIEVLRR